jgi:hypothetical protein
MQKTVKAWGISADPNELPLLSTVTENRRATRDIFSHDRRMKWKQLYGQGWRCVPVLITYDDGKSKGGGR